MIKQIDITDIELAHKLLALSLRAYSQEAKIIEYPDFPPLEESITSLMSSKSTFYGYFANGKLAGGIEIEIRQSVPWISRLVVDPDHFKQGIGSKLLNHVTTGVERIFVGTAEKNFPAIKLYKKMGFTFRSTEQVGFPAINWVTYSKDHV